MVCINTDYLWVQTIIKEVPGVITDVAVSGKEALEKAAISEPQAVFLDIDMPDMNGIELAHILIKKYKHLSLVFATAYPDHALEAFELYSVDYILKPYDDERIKKTVKKLVDKSNLGQSEAAILIKTKKQMVFIKPSNMKSKILSMLSMFLLFVASAGVQPACLFHWYQPRIPE